MKAPNYDLTPLKEYLETESPKDVTERLRNIQLNYSEVYTNQLEIVASSDKEPDWFNGILISAKGDMAFLKWLADAFEKIEGLQTA